MEERIIKCCFCGKEIDFRESHNARPIVTANGDRCCIDCNSNIVIPTRIAVWANEDDLKKKLLDYSEQISKITKTLLNISKGMVE